MFPAQFSKKDLGLIFNNVAAKLKSDQLTFQILKLLMNVPHTLIDPAVSVCIMENTMISLQKQDKQYRQLAVKALSNQLSDAFPDHLANEFVKQSRNLITSGDNLLSELAFSFLSQLLKLKPKLAFPYVQESITQVLSARVTPEIKDFFRRLQRVGEIQSDLQKRDLKKEETLIAGEILASAILGQEKDIASQIRKLIVPDRLSLATARVLCRSVQVDLFDQLTKMIDSSDQAEVAVLVALVLGSAAIPFLPKLLSLVSAKGSYYYYCSLRELVEHSNQLGNVQSLFEYLLKEVVGKDKNLLNLISEILGKLIQIDFSKLVNPLLQGLKS